MDIGNNRNDHSSIRKRWSTHIVQHIVTSNEDMNYNAKAINIVTATNMLINDKPKIDWFIINGNETDNLATSELINFFMHVDVICINS